VEKATDGNARPEELLPVRGVGEAVVVEKSFGLEDDAFAV
jgi:hypothetical protein